MGVFSLIPGALKMWELHGMFMGYAGAFSK